MRTRRLLTGLLATAALSVLALSAKAQIEFYPYSYPSVSPFVYPILLPQSSFPGVVPLNPMYFSGPAYQIGTYDYFSALYPGYQSNFYNSWIGPFDIPRTSDVIEARLEEDSTQLWVGWRGESRAVQRIQIDLLDKDRKVVSQKYITQLPAETRLALDKQAVSYRVIVWYINGTVTAVTSPLGERKAAVEKQPETETDKTEPNKEKAVPDKEKPVSDPVKTNGSGPIRK